MPLLQRGSCFLCTGSYPGHARPSGPSLSPAGGILAGVISDRLEKRASTCGLMLLLAAPTVRPAPNLIRAPAPLETAPLSSPQHTRQLPGPPPLRALVSGNGHHLNPNQCPGVRDRQPGRGHGAQGELPQTQVPPLGAQSGATPLGSQLAGCLGAAGRALWLPVSGRRGLPSFLGVSTGWLLPEDHFSEIHIPG